MSIDKFLNETGTMMVNDNAAFLNELTGVDPEILKNALTSGNPVEDIPEFTALPIKYQNIIRSTCNRTSSYVKMSANEKMYYLDNHVKNNFGKSLF